MADKFSYNYNGLKYNDAEKQVAKQVDPLYSRAVNNVYQQKYRNDVQAGQVAAARGLGRSGLSADAINKNGLAAQGQIGDIQAQRASQVAQMANDLTERDKDRGMQARSQAYSEWMGQQSLNRDDRDFTYRKGRDAIADTQWNKQFDFQKESYADDKKWREYTYKNMSATEKAQLEWAKKQYGEDAAWRLYEMEYQGELSKSMSDAEREFYGSLGLGDFLP